MNTALVIIDIQNDYFAGGACELHEPEPAAKNAAKILAKFRELNLAIFHVQHISNRAGGDVFSA